MVTDDDTSRRARSAADESADAAKAAVHSTAGTAGAAADLVQETTDRGADTAKRLTEQSSREFGRFINFSAEASQDAARQFNRNLDVLLQVGTVMAQGYRSILSEWSDCAQQVARRNADALNDILKVRSAHDLFSVQGDLLKDGVQHLLSTGARLSELSARVANEAVGKLNKEAAEHRTRSASAR
jgi:hypothetical protein